MRLSVEVCHKDHGVPSGCPWCAINSLRAELEQVRKANDQLFAHGEKMFAERAAALAKLSVFDGSDCADDMAAGDGPCGVCATCLKRELDAAREDARRYRAALRRGFFLEHNEREWETLDECQAYARRECAAIDAALRKVKA